MPFLTSLQKRKEDKMTEELKRLLHRVRNLQALTDDDMEKIKEMSPKELICLINTMNEVIRYINEIVDKDGNH